MRRRRSDVLPSTVLPSTVCPTQLFALLNCLPSTVCLQLFALLNCLPYSTVCPTQLTLPDLSKGVERKMGSKTKVSAAMQALHLRFTHSDSILSVSALLGLFNDHKVPPPPPLLLCLPSTVCPELTLSTVRPFSRLVHERPTSRSLTLCGGRALLA